MRDTADDDRRAAASRVCFALLGSIAGFLFTGRLDAHDTWILPGRSGVAPGQRATFDLTSGMAFPVSEVGVKAERLARASTRLSGNVSDLVREVDGEKALQLNARFPNPGIATVWIESKPRSLELKPAEVKEYLQEIGVWDTVGKKWESAGTGRWRESYTKHAKTFVRVGRPGSDRSWSQPVGMELELVPESDPTTISSGEELTVRLLKGGRPGRDVPIGLVAAGAESGTLTRTDAEGRARLRFDRAGWWLIRVTVLDPSSTPGLDWESRFTTLTLFVGTR